MQVQHGVTLGAYILWGYPVRVALGDDMRLLIMISYKQCVLLVCSEGYEVKATGCIPFPYKVMVLSFGLASD